VSRQPRIVTSAERLRRLLALVPYVAARKVVGLAQTAATFGMTERELIDDLNLAWCVELRSPEPYCPIDLSYEDGEISISQAESIARPLRLAADEASALLVALRMLADATSGAAGTSGSGAPNAAGATDPAERGGPGGPGEDGTAIARLIAKIEEAAGTAGAASAQVAIHLDQPGAGDTAAVLSTALAQGRRVHLRHYKPNVDEETERDVDPMRLLVVDGRTYLEGWCRRAEGVRLFRLDRVLSVSVLDVPASVPDDAEPRNVDAGLFRPSPSDVLAELDLAPAARWVAESNVCESVTEQPDGWLRIGLRTPDTTWVRRLALRLGEDARVVAPPALADDVHSAAAATLALYDPPARPAHPD
jgi:proteasome accessory factor C